MTGTRFGVSFSVLGTLEVACRGVPVPVSRPRRRALLALLLLHHDRALSVDEIVVRLWGDEPPQTARTQVHTLVSAVRRALPGGDQLLQTRPDGYRLPVDACELDLLAFAERLEAGRAAARRSDVAAAIDHYRAGLRLWRGTPLADVNACFVPRIRQRLTEQRLTAVEELTELRLRHGQHSELIAELTELVDAYPARERLRRQLMLALYRAGRRLDALDLYRAWCTELADHHGLDPSPDLHRLAQQLLRGDSQLEAAPTSGEPTPGEPTPGEAVPEPVREPATKQVPVPRQLPLSAAHFSGRDAELATLDRTLGGEPDSTAIVAVTGAGGVGKTALAVHWGHRHAERFPDGQLYVDLRGYHPDTPLSQGDALAGFLRALGVSGADIPHDLAERAALFRSLMHGRRILVLLDNASDTEHVEALLPGAASCAVVVTSRDNLTGLVARYGAHRVPLDVLPDTDAIALLRRLLAERVAHEPEAALAVATECGRLPLALRIAAERAVASPGMSLADLAGDLADVRRRLDLLEAGQDRRTAVRAVFSWSYRRLSADAAAVFRLLGLHPGSDVDASAVAALLGGAADPRPALDELHRAHLVSRGTSGRYAMHDLLRVWAAEQAAGDPAAERTAAVRRLLRHYLYGTSVAMSLAYPNEQHLRPTIPKPDVGALSFPDSAAALAWLDAERSNLLAVTADPVRWPTEVMQMSGLLWRYLDTRAHFLEAQTLHERALVAAESVGDVAGQARARNRLAVAYSQMGEYERAAELNQRSLAGYRECGDLAGEAGALGNLGILCERSGDYRQAVVHHQRACELFEMLDDPAGQARELTGLGVGHARLGEPERAVEHYSRALRVFRELGDPIGVAGTLGFLGGAYGQLGDFATAAEHTERAVQLFGEAGALADQVDALTELARVHTLAGDYPSAEQRYQQATAIADDIGHTAGRTTAANGLGDVALHQGRLEQAGRHHQEALRYARQIGDRYEVARAHQGLGDVARATGELAEAEVHWRRGYAIFHQLGVPEADEIAAKLAALPGSTPEAAAVER